MSKIILDAQLRNELGKGASRRLRREDKVLAIVYGGDKAPVSITLESNKVLKASESESFYSSIIGLNIGSEVVDVLVKDLQRHAFKAAIMHIDFLRVNANHAINTVVPVHFINEDTAPAVKDLGGTVQHHINELEITCLPADLPAFIEIDATPVALGQTLHLSDIILPKGVVSVELAKGGSHDQAVITISTGKGVTEEAAESAEDAAE